MRFIIFKLMKKFFATLCLLAVASCCVFGKQDLAKIQARSMGLLQPQQVLIQKKEESQEKPDTTLQKTSKATETKEEHEATDKKVTNLLIDNRGQERQTKLEIAASSKSDHSVAASSEPEPSTTSQSKLEQSVTTPSKQDPFVSVPNKPELPITVPNQPEPSITIPIKPETTVAFSSKSESLSDISKHESTPNVPQHVEIPSVSLKKDISPTLSLHQQSISAASAPKIDTVLPKKVQSLPTPSISSDDNTLVLSFDYAPRENRALSDSHAKVLWNGVVVYSVVPKDFAIHTASVEVTSKSGPNVLQFEGSENSNGYGLTIDNVKLVKKGTTKDLVINGGFQNPNLKGGWKQMTKIEGWQGTPLQIGAGKIYNSRWTSQIAELDSTQNYKLTQHFTFP